MAIVHKLSIGGVKIRVETECEQLKDPDADPRWTPFLKECDWGEPDINIVLSVTHSYGRFDSEILYVTYLDQKQSSKGLTSQEMRLRQERKSYLGQDVDWRLCRIAGDLLIEGGLTANAQMRISQDFRDVRLSLVRDEPKYYLSDIFFSLLQHLLCIYLSKNGFGFVVHASAVLDEKNDGGYLFCGESGAGKTTISRLWSDAGGASILNDDRVIVRFDGESRIYGTPWHGDNTDYMQAMPGSCRLTDVYFIHQARQNTLENMSVEDFVKTIHENIISINYDKTIIENNINTAIMLAGTSICRKLGFTKTKSLPDFIRNNRS